MLKKVVKQKLRLLKNQVKKKKNILPLKNLQRVRRNKVLLVIPIVVLFLSPSLPCHPPLPIQ